MSHSSTHSAGPALPSVAEVLELAELQVGDPTVDAGNAGLHREVRWAHVAADSNVAGSVDGGELVLMTAAAWPTGAEHQRTFTDELIAAGISAIALELGQGLDRAPEAMIRSCNAHNLPLIVLHRQVRFVQITQRLHQRILARQTEALEAREDVHHMLTELGLNRSPVDYVVERLAATLGAPVVLEDSAHRVVAVAELGLDPVDVLEGWRRSGAPGLDPNLDLEPNLDRVPVEARGTKWGHLTALPGPEHPAGRKTVLELGAFALALGRLADTDGEQWHTLASKRVFDALLTGRYRNDVELETQLAAAGITFRGRAILVALLRSSGNFGGHPTLEHAIIETALRRAIAPEGHALVAADASTDSGSLLAVISLPVDDRRARLFAGKGASPLAQRLSDELDMLVPGSTPPAWRTHLALGAEVHNLRGLVAALDQLRAANTLEAVAEVGRVTLQQVEQQPLAHLIRALTAAPELQAFAAEMLSPLLQHDRTPGPGHSGDLVQVLGAYLATPTNRSVAATQARLSRSVFYQRLELIEDLLGVNLNDGHTIAALTVALLAHPAAAVTAASPSYTSPQLPPRSR